MIYDRNNKPTQIEIRNMIKKNIQGISPDPRSVDIRAISGPFYDEEFGWIVLVNFNWVNLKGNRQREIKYFSIKTSYLLSLITDQRAAEYAYNKAFFKSTKNL